MYSATREMLVFQKSMKKKGIEPKKKSKKIAEYLIEKLPINEN